MQTNPTFHFSITESNFLRKLLQPFNFQAQFIAFLKITGFTAGIELSFSSKPAVSKVGGQEGDSKNKKKESEAKSKEVVVVAAQRAQNLTIAISRLKVGAEEVAVAVLSADMGFLSEDRVDLLQRLALEEDESAGLKAAEVWLKLGCVLGSTSTFLFNRTAFHILVRLFL